MQDMDTPCPRAEARLRGYLAIVLGAVVALALGIGGGAIWLAPSSGDLVRIGGWSARDFGWQGSKSGHAADHYDRISVPALLDGASPGDILVFGDSFSTPQRGGISWINTLHMRSGHMVRFVRVEDFRAIGRYLDSDAFRRTPPGALIVETVEREAVHRALQVHDPDRPCAPPGPARPMAAAQAAPLDLPPLDFTRRARFDSMDEMFSWGALAIRIRLKGRPDAPMVGLNRADLFSSRRSDRMLIYRDDILRHIPAAFPGAAPAAAIPRAVCGLRQLAARAGDVPLRVVIAPDKRSVYADWITTPLPGKPIDVFALARVALGDIVVDLYGPLRRAAPLRRDVYYPDDSHWGPEGHRIAGRTVAAALSP